MPARALDLAGARLPAKRTPLTYGPDDAVRLVSSSGRISFRNRDYFISHGLAGLLVAVRRTTAPGHFTVWHGPRQVATIDLPEQV